MSTLGMPQSPNPPTDNDAPSSMPSMASCVEATTLSMLATFRLNDPSACDSR